jgi:exodeoxyribonuclease V gamma subunit
MAINVFFSNQMEILFSEFKKHLFNGTHPFSKRLIIVPSAAMKGWLLRCLAQDKELGIAAGVQIGYIEPMVCRLCSLFQQKKNRAPPFFYEPENVEIALAIEKEIAHVCENYHTFSCSLQKEWEPLLEYLTLSKAGLPCSKRSEKRKNSLAATLADLFIEYGKYGGRMIANWQKTPLHWQQMLWMAIEKRFEVWNYPYRKLETFIPNQTLDPSEYQIHLFGLSYLSPLHYRFFLKLSEQLPTSYYLLSPCLKFWSDLLSQNEGRLLQRKLKFKKVPVKQREALDEFLQDNNPLLANFGRVGREMALQIESGALASKESYALPSTALQHPAYQELTTDDVLEEKKNRELTLLEAVQTDLLLLRNPENSEKIAFDRYDRTIQVHASSNRAREVHALYNLIMSILDTHQTDSDPFLLGDFVVMCPNLGKAAPYIQSVFGSAESRLNFQLMDLHFPAANEMIKGFLHLIALPSGRWDAVSLLRLFDFPAFQSKQRLNRENLACLRRWIQDANIHWGNDEKHRNTLLQRDHCEKEVEENFWFGTWEHGFGRLLDTMMLIADQKDPSDQFAPLEGFEISQSELLGTFIKLLHSLSEDLKPLIDGTQFTLSDWTLYLKALCDSYFQPTTPEENEGYTLLLTQIEMFSRADRLLNKETFAFSSISRHLLKALQTELIGYRETNLQTVRFCSLLPMRAVPAKVIILMGMEEQAYPRKEEAFSLNLLQTSPEADYTPSQTDFDRYLFLEALISARRYFIISYLSQGGKDIKEHAPSILVQELLSYLDRAFTVPEGKLSIACHYSHPKCAFDRRYFSPDFNLKNYLTSHYKAALAYGSAVKKPHNFLTEFHKESESDPSQKIIKIDLADLLSFAKNPLKRFFATLGFYFEREEERLIKQEEALSLSSLNAAILAKQGMYTAPEKILGWAERIGRLPQGPFKALGAAQVLEQIATYKSALTSDNSLHIAWMNIQFNERHQTPQLINACWTLPPLIIDFEDRGKVEIVGEIDSISNDGIFLFEKDGMDTAVAKWPLLLVYCALIDRNDLPLSKNVIFAKSGKIKDSAFIDAPNMLQQYLRYYLQSLLSPSPLMPQWIASLLNGSIKEIEAEFEEEKEGNIFVKRHDASLKWLKRCSPEIDLLSALNNWQNRSRELFAKLSENWYS